MKAIVAFAALVFVVEAAEALICIRSTCPTPVLRWGKYCGDTRNPTIYCHRIFYETPECNKVCDAGLSEWTTVPPDNCSRRCGGGARAVTQRRACNGNLRDVRAGETCTYQSFQSLERVPRSEPCNTHPCPQPNSGCLLPGRFCVG